MRRIDRGVLTGTMLARQTGLKQAHLSNFLNRKRNLSLRALDRVMAAQLISIAGFLSPLHPGNPVPASDAGAVAVPLVSQSVARLSAIVASGSVLDLIHLPSEFLSRLPHLRPAPRKNWQRFTAVRINPAQTLPMLPVLRPGSILVLDRYDTVPRNRQPSQPCVYAIGFGADIVFSYAAIAPGQLILRPHALEHELKSIAIASGESFSTHVIGRVCAVLSEL